MADSIYAPQNYAPDHHHNDDDDETDATPPAHPFLTKPLLYVSGVDPQSQDQDLASGPLQQFLPVRLHIDRNVPAGQSASGTVEFQTLDKAEKALATVRALKLTIAEPGSSNEPQGRSKPRLIKQLPATTDDQYLYDLFRPFGAIARAHCILTNPAGHHTGFRGMANVEYYDEEDAQRAQNEMHCVEIEGKTISVSIDNVTRRGDFSAQAAPFVPNKLSAQAPAFSPPPLVQSGSSGSMYASTPPPNQLDSSKGPIWNVPGSNLQYSSAAATYIDPCNLFCKNLCPSLASGDLFNLFKPFGRIVSARVMRDEQGTSREFGFVSFHHQDDAARALHAINGQQIGSKTIMVRLHEPKKMRQDKLNKLFAGGGGSSSSGDNTAGASPGQSPLLGGVQSPSGESGQGSKDYLNQGNGDNASISNGHNQQTHVFNESHLSTLPVDVRSEVLNTEFTRRVREVPNVSREGQVKDVVQGLLALGLSDQVKSLNEASEFALRVNDIRDTLPVSPGPAPVSSSGGLAPSSGSSLAVPVSSSGGADSASMVSTAPASSKERARLLKAVSEVMPPGSAVEDVTDLLAGLSKKDRAMALFNPQFLRVKVDEAKEILDMSDSPEDEEEPSVSVTKESPPVHTLSSLAKLPCSEIISLATSPNTSSGLPLPKPNPETWSSTETFMDKILNSETKETEQKQKLGDVLFKKIRTLFGTSLKGLPKITITLLDTEELRSLAHVMDSFPEVLKEKVLLIANNASK
ncbi:unnamed protein product [Sympodiomycopsis kandeliae]